MIEWRFTRRETWPSHKSVEWSTAAAGDGQPQHPRCHHRHQQSWTSPLGSSYTLSQPARTTLTTLTYCWHDNTTTSSQCRSHHCHSQISSVSSLQYGMASMEQTEQLLLRNTNSHLCNSRRFEEIFRGRSRGWIGLCSVLRPHQHSIGHMGHGFYRSKDPTNSIKVLKEKLRKLRKNQTT